MQVYGPAYLHGPQPLAAPHVGRAAAGESRPATRGIGDEVQISSAAQWVDRVSEIPEIRADRVAALRAQIQSGLYESDDKLSTALDRLLDEIG